MTATKTAPKKSSPKTRKTRTPEQMVADLEAEIARVKARAAAKEAKAAPEGKPFLAAVKALDKATIAAKAADNQPMVGALEAARATVGQHLATMGVAAPKTRPRKSKGQAA